MHIHLVRSVIRETGRSLSDIEILLLKPVLSRTEHRVDFYDRLEMLEQYAYMQHELENKSPLYFYENGTLKVGGDKKASNQFHYSLERISFCANVVNYVRRERWKLKKTGARHFFC